MNFHLPPWDRNRPRLHPPQADCIVKWGTKTYLLRAENGLLFFRDTDDLEKTWAIATPLPTNIEGQLEEYPAFFQQELEVGKVARYFLHLLDGRERPMFFRIDGTGFCRESWNRDDIEFSHEMSRHQWLEGNEDSLKETAKRAFIDCVLPTTEAMSYPDATNWSKDVPVEWLCGSQQELEKWARFAAYLEGDWLWKQGEFMMSFQTESQFARAGFLGFEAEDYDWDWEILYGDGYSHEVDKPFKYPFFTYLPSRRFMTLCDLIVDENTPIGFYWEYLDAFSGRETHSPQSLKVKLPLLAPTHHEKTEARLQLHEWLRGKVPDAEIEQLLNDDAPADLPDY